MVVVPVTFVAVASPMEFMVATCWFDEDHVTELDMSFVDPSAKVAMAENC